jgi:two-component system NtrC family response regulator
MANILIIDDDRLMAEMLVRKIEGLGHQVNHAATLKEGLEWVVSTPIDVVLLDIHLPDGSGLDIIPQIRALGESPEVIVMTGAGDSDGVERALRHGAWDYVEKGSSLQTLVLPLCRSLEYRKQKTPQDLSSAFKREGIIGESSQIRRCMEIVAQAAKSGANVLISGETGTGKERFALCVHANRHPADKNFVVVDCAALPDNIVESVLFGHVRGSFTGADRDSKGLIRQADGGTLFLDEVGELSLSLQKAFLRVLQEHRFRPVGSEREVESHFQLVAATNRDLDKMAEAGHFRKDLLYRIRSMVIHLPPLRERLEDLESLANHCLDQICSRQGIDRKAISEDLLAGLLTYRWPGNVRELMAVLERLIAVAGDAATLYFQDLPRSIQVSIRQSKFERPTAPPTPAEPSAHSSSPVPTLESVLAESEARYLNDLITFSEGDMRNACRISGVSRSRLYALLKKHRLPLRPSLRQPKAS